MIRTKSIRVTEELHKRLRLYSASKDLTISETVEQACKLYLEPQKPTNKKAP